MLPLSQRSQEFYPVLKALCEMGPDIGVPLCRVDIDAKAVQKLSFCAEGSMFLTLSMRFPVENAAVTRLT